MKQVAHVHLEAETREAELVRLREGIRIADQSNNTGADEMGRKEDLGHSLKKQYEDASLMIHWTTYILSFYRIYYSI